MATPHPDILNQLQSTAATDVPSTDSVLPTEIKYQKEIYECLTLNYNFAKKQSNIAYIQPDAEVILVSDKHRKNIINRWTRFVAEKRLNLSTTPEQLLNYVSQFTVACFSKSPPVGMTKDKCIQALITAHQKTNHVIPINKALTLPALSLTTFIKEQCGVSRHCDLVNCIVIAHLITEKSLAHGQVQHFRYTTTSRKKDEHTVATYTQESTLWVIDSINPNPFYLIPLEDLPSHPKNHTNEARALRFYNLVGKPFYAEMLKQLLPLEPLRTMLNQFKRHSREAARSHPFTAVPLPHPVPAISLDSPAPLSDDPNKKFTAEMIEWLGKIADPHTVPYSGPHFGKPGPIISHTKPDLLPNESASPPYKNPYTFGDSFIDEQGNILLRETDPDPGLKASF